MGSEAAADVVIPTWNRRESLRRTLESLREQTAPVAVTVVDNASSDGTGEMIAREFEEVRRIALDSNLGFGAAVNRGIAACAAEWVVLLNNDTVAEPSFAAELIAAGERAGSVMVAGCLRRPDGTIESLGVEIDSSLVAYDVWYGEPYERTLREPAPEPLAPSGGAAGFRRARLLELGGFDEEMFAYLEDVELGIRVRLSGGRCAAAPRAVAWHEHSGTLGSGAPAKNRLMGRGRGYLLWKHGAALPRLARARGALIDAAVYAGQAAIDHNLDGLRGRIEERRRLAARARPPADPRLASLPLVERRVSEALRTRLARRGRRGLSGTRRPSPPPDDGS
ncbi:MAG: glycosyltransferase family 2 protein [Solirubrobacterales bacterium]